MSLNNFKQLPYGILLLIFIGLKLLVSFSFGCLESDLIENDIINESTNMEKFWLSIVLAPLIETFLFTMLIIEFSLHLFQRVKIKNYIAILFSAILFSWSHNFSVVYIIYAFITGLIYGWLYLLTKNRGVFMAFSTVFLVHFINNSVAFLADGF